MQLACTLGNVDSRPASNGLSRIAIAGRDDPFITSAIMSSITRKNFNDVLHVLIGADRERPSAAMVKKLTALAADMEEYGILWRLLDFVTAAEEGKFRPWQMAALGGL